MERTIHWRYADQGNGQPGPAVPVIGNSRYIAAAGIDTGRAIQINLSSDPATGTWLDRSTPVPPADPARIPIITKSPGNRDNIVPAAFYEGGQDELIDPVTHPHIMGFTHVAIRDGDWSDAAMWNTGTVPGSGAIVSTGTYFVDYDLASDAILKDVLVPMGSTLRWSKAVETRIRLDYIMTMGTVILVDPAESATPGKARHEIIFHRSVAPGPSTRLGAMFMGASRILGGKKTGHLRAGLLGGQTVPTIPAGATTITLPGLAASGWRVGDTIVVLGTEYVLPATSDPQYTGPTSYYSTQGRILTKTLNEYQFGQDEQRTITAISGDVVTLSSALANAHTGMKNTLTDGQVITVAPVVANVSRSIRFRSASAAEDGALDASADLADLQKRAHIMFMRHPDVDTRYFETKNMGRTSTDPTLFVGALPYRVEMAGGSTFVEQILSSASGTPIADPDNVRGRYAIHYHWCGGPYASAPQINCIGVTSWAPQGEVPVPGWAITQHGTRMAIEDCVVANVRGAGIVSELGNEIGQWARNVVTGCRGDGDKDDWGSRAETYTNHNGHQGVAFENQSRAIIMHDNIAGSSKYGFLWHSQKDNHWRRSPRDVDLRLMDGMTQGAWFPLSTAFPDEYYGVVNVQIPPFKRNEAHACRTGFSVIHRGGDGRKLDKTPMLIDHFHCLNVPFAWEVPQYSNSYYVKDCLFQGPLNMMSTSEGVGAGNVSWDWNFANIHMKNYSRGFSVGGAGINYEGHFIDISTENVPQFSTALSVTVTGINQHQVRNVMGGWVETGTNSAIVRQHVSLDSTTDLPQPYPLAPYGRKLPSGYPAVNPGDTPYFVLGDGINGAATTDPVAINLTLTAGTGRDQGRFHGIIRDSVGDRRYPDWQSSETFPSNINIKSHRTFYKLQPEQVVQRHGCWNDNGVWKTRTWFMGADRFTHVRFTFHADWTLVGFSAQFLAAHDVGGPSPAPVWPDKLERVPDQARPLAKVTRSLRFLSRTRMEVVEGQPLTHRLRYDTVSSKLAIVGGADAAQFRISSQQLQWASGGTRARNGADANGDNTYEVIVRLTDGWGNSHDQAHQVVVVPSARVSAEIADDFTRADENLDADPAYVMIRGAAGSFGVRANKVANLLGTSPPAIIDMGSLGTSEQEISVNFSGFNSSSYVLFRMVDENNWLGFQRVDGGSTRLGVVQCVGGTITGIADFSNPATRTIRVIVRGRRLIVAEPSNGDTILRYPKSGNWKLALPLELDALTEPGAVLLPDGLPMGTKVGLASGGTVNPWIDNFSAKALPS